jgi:glycosyltransferase involved in cell wall biosynthesis
MKKYKSKPIVSIIIRTKNEDKWIESCLKSIFNQSYKNFEIILVDNESADNTVVIAKKFKVKIFRIKKFKPGLAINYGIKNSKGKIIVCLSGHCIPVNEHWLKNLVKDLSKNKIAGVYGRQEPLSFSSDIDKRDLINTFGLDKKIQFKDSFFHNANSAFLRSVWKKFPFDEEVSNIEDRVWGEQVIENGYKIIYEPKANVFHYHGLHHNNQNDLRIRNVVKILDNLKSTSTKKKIKFKKKLNIVALIPIKGKTKFFGNSSLLEITINSAKKSKLIKDIMVLSDNDDTIKLAKKLGAIAPFKRPKSLSEDYILINDILKYAFEKTNQIKKYDLIVCLDETYPFRESDLIDNMIRKFSSENLDTIFAGKQEKKSIWLQKKNQTQLISEGFMPRDFKEEKTIISLFGMCSVTYPEIIKSGNIFSGKTGIYQVNDSISNIEIRDEKSFKIYKNLLIKNEK